ncbi:hypothetical protein HOY82DRAFT_624654 [Tuber indicum]|nr:hypothetical protein HOY82DRAFT_624654 [Tuber indicum]
MQTVLIGFKYDTPLYYDTVSVVEAELVGESREGQGDVRTRICHPAAPLFTPGVPKDALSCKQVWIPQVRQGKCLTPCRVSDSSTPGKRTPSTPLNVLPTYREKSKKLSLGLQQLAGKQAGKQAARTGMQQFHDPFPIRSSTPSSHTLLITPHVKDQVTVLEDKVLECNRRTTPCSTTTDRKEKGREKKWNKKKRKKERKTHPNTVQARER